MPAQLRRYLRTYEFLQRALDEHGESMRAQDAERIRRERDHAFLAMINHASSDPRVAQAQIAYFVSMLAKLAGDSEAVEPLTAACSDAVARLAAQAQASRDVVGSVQPGQAVAAASPGDVAKGGPCIEEPARRLLDSLPDRAAIYSRDYRYLFTNAANAAFHRRPARDFIERPIWHQVGAKCFEDVTKPNLDMVFAGASTSHVAALQLASRSFVYAISYDPMRDAAGHVTSVLVVARDVTHLGVEAQVVWPAPDE